MFFQYNEGTNLLFDLVMDISNNEIVSLDSSSQVN